MKRLTGLSRGRLPPGERPGNRKKKEGLSGATRALGPPALPGSPFVEKVPDAPVNVSFDNYDFGHTGNGVEEARFTAASLGSQEEAEKARPIFQVKAAYYRCLQTEALLKWRERLSRSESSQHARRTGLLRRSVALEARRQPGRGEPERGESGGFAGGE
jgi:hypothetical protein